MQWIRVFLAVGFVAAAGLGFVTVMESAKLVPADGTAGAQFAGSAAAAGSTAVFGAEGDSPNGAGSGSAYVAVRTGTTWSQQAKIVPADGAAGDGFGKSVAVSADTLVVGSPRDDDGGAD